MIDHATLQSYWTKRIRNDLASFADPNSTVEHHAVGRDLHITWDTHGRTRHDTFRVASDGVYRLEGSRKQPYRRFLAGPAMADLRTVASMILRASPDDIFVPTKARTDNKNATDALKLLQNLMANDGQLTATRVVMVTGEAGGGKTRVLRELVRQQAQSYLNAETEVLFLYVNAQGRALARLNEALATELQDLRVNLTYHSVSSLTRLGLLVPVIDGFDELLGVSGYDDAFASLSRFLEQLEGEGQLIASARSIYYEEEFRVRTARHAESDARWEEVPVSICAWSDEEQSAYARELANNKHLSVQQRNDLEENLKQVFSEQGQALARKPFFLARTAELILDDYKFAIGDDLLTQLVQGFFQREREDKLLDRQGDPLLSSEDLDLVLCELALEMWNQETRELDKKSVQEVAEYVLTIRDVPASTQQILLERVPSLASLIKSRDGFGLAFEHEAFFFYFLTRAIVSQYFVEQSDLRVVLGRSALPEDVANRIGAALWQSHESEGDLRQRADALGDAARRDWLRAAQVQQNAGLILLALIRSCAYAGREVTGLVFRSVVFPGGHLKDVICRDCTFNDVTFRRTDLTHAKFFSCQAENLMMIEPRVSAKTRLEFCGLDPSRHVHGLSLVNGSGEIVYDPVRVAKAVMERGGPKQPDCGPALEVAENFFGLVERLMRAYRRANPVCADDPRYKTVFKDRDWPVVLSLLLRHGLITDEVRPTKGRPKRFYRRQFLPAEIMAGRGGASSAPLPVQKFWRELAGAGQ